jgi:CheY-like chemotaxis protein
MLLNVYYVDDEIELCELFVDMFSSFEVTVKTFTDPFIALEYAKKNPPDLLFTDYRMPGMNGVELAKKLDPLIKKYLITGENNLIIDFNFEAILYKPIKPKLILEILAKK